MTFREWTGALRCSDGPQPGTAALMQVAEDALADEGHMNWGIYNCRTVRGGSTTSLHGEGRAGDSGFAVGDSTGDLMLQVLLGKAWPLGIQALIYERTIYSALSPHGRPYFGVAPHDDHIHWEQTWHAARNLSLRRARNVFGEGLEAARPKPERTRVVDYSNVRRKFINAAVSGEPTRHPNAGVKWTAIALNRAFTQKPEWARIDGRVDAVLLRMWKRWEAGPADMERPNVIPQLGPLRLLGEQSGLFEVRV